MGNTEMEADVKDISLLTLIYGIWGLPVVGLNRPAHEAHYLFPSRTEV